MRKHPPSFFLGEIESKKPVAHGNNLLPIFDACFQPGFLQPYSFLMVRSLKSDSSGDSDRSVFDPVRRKRVHLGPEEEVRQAILLFLVQNLNIPKGLIAVEMDIGDPQVTFRADIVVHDRNGKPWMVVECKAPDVRISQNTFDQVSRYNRHLRAPYLLVSNGSMQYCCKQDASSGVLTYLEQMPDYPLSEDEHPGTLSEMDHV